MLNLIGKAITGVMLTREARDAVRDVGGLASAIQASADARVLKAAGMPLPPIGATALTSPRTWAAPVATPLAIRSEVSELFPMRVPVASPGAKLGPSVKSAPRVKPAPIEPAPPEAIQTKDFLTPERAALIQNAMKVHSAKQTILAHLTDEQRAKLQSIAMKAMLPQSAE